MLSPNKTIIAQKLLANLGVFMRHSSTVEPTTIFPTKKLNESAMKKWAIVSPSVLPCQITSQLVTGVELTPIATTWAVLDTHANEIVDCGSLPLFSEDAKVGSSAMLELAHRIKRLMPESDLFVMEDKMWTKVNRSNSDMGCNLLIFQSMLYTLLNDQFNPDKVLHKVFYIQPKALLKLFKLKVGNERVSSQHIVQRMIRRSEVGYILENRWENIGSLETPNEYYGDLCWTNPDMVKRIWTRDELWRENISNAILTAYAFTDLCLREDGNALRILWKRGS